MKKSELKKLIKEEISKVLEANEDIASLVKKHWNKNKLKTQNLVSQELGRDLTPVEKGKLTRAWDKIEIAKWMKGVDKQEKTRDSAYIERKNKGLLPFKVDDKEGVPDPQYYEPDYRRIPKKGGGVSLEREPSGYTNYKLKDKYSNTPVTGDIKLGKDYVSVEGVWDKLYGL
jgi:hypothetical protein